MDGAARHGLHTSADGSTVEWTNNVDLPGTLDVTGATDLDGTLNVDGATTIQDDLIVKSDNKEFAVQNAAGTDKFTVDTDNGNTVITGSLTAASITGDAIETASTSTSDTKVYSAKYSFTS